MDSINCDTFADFATRKEPMRVMRIRTSDIFPIRHRSDPVVPGLVHDPKFFFPGQTPKNRWVPHSTWRASNNEAFPR